MALRLLFLLKLESDGILVLVSQWKQLIKTISGIFILLVLYFMVLAQFCLCNQRVPANRSVNGKSHIVFGVANVLPY